MNLVARVDNVVLIDRSIDVALFLFDVALVSLSVHPRRWSPEEDERLRASVDKHHGVSKG